MRTDQDSADHVRTIRCGTADANRAMAEMREAAAKACRQTRELVGAATGSSIAMALAEAEDRIRALPVRVEAERNYVSVLRALFIAAPGHQGGHSDSGHAIAEALCIPFPLTMPSLRAAAIDCGFHPYALWPWLDDLENGE